MAKLKTPDPLLDIAHRLEEAALTDPYSSDCRDEVRATSSRPSDTS
jgi:hypothetical protein